MALCTDYCLRNLEGTLCYLLDNETLRLHPDIFLPSEICDRLVNEYVSGLWRSCLFWEGAGSSGNGERSSLKRVMGKGKKCGRTHRAFFSPPHIGNKDLHYLQKEVSPGLLYSSFCGNHHFHIGKPRAKQSLLLLRTPISKGDFPFTSTESLHFSIKLEK